MEAKYGRKRLDDLEASATSRKWTRPELLEIKEYYKKKINELGTSTSGEITGVEMHNLFDGVSPPDSLL